MDHSRLIAGAFLRSLSFPSAVIHDEVGVEVICGINLMTGRLFVIMILEAAVQKTMNRESWNRAFILSPAWL